MKITDTASLSTFVINEGPRNLLKVREDPQKNETFTIVWLPLFIIPWLVIFLITLLTYYMLPTSITLATESANPNRFIGERAKLLNEEIANIGPKVVGSDENELKAVSFLMTEIAKIKDAANSIHLIEEQIQTSSGIMPMGRITYYQGIQNVVVKISPRNGTTVNSLLINTHFDTVADGPGAGDAGTLVAVMLEVLRVLSQLPNTLKHSVVFLFNGAEEASLIGSYAFITKHRWARNVRVFINMDSCGTGGREVLFQSTAQPWLMNHYKSVPNPTASVVGDELFKSGIIPSDTDFRIFHYYGSLRGLDFAIYRNGYVYHTKHDVPELIPASTFQNTGDNILALTIAVANSDELGNDNPNADDGDLIFFDFVNWFMISYTTTTAMVINVVVSVLAMVGILISLYSFAKNSGSISRIAKEFSAIVIFQLISMLLSAGVVFLLAYVYDKGLRSMSWFSSPWLLFGIYFCPLFFCLGIVPSLYIMFRKTKILKRSNYVQMFMHAQCLWLVLITLVLTLLGVRSTFIIVVSIIFYTLTTFINYFTRLQLQERTWIIVTAIGQVIPFVFYSYYIIIILDMFIPIQARSTQSQNPDYIIGCIVIGFGILMGGFLIPTLCMFKRPALVILGFLGTFVVFGIVMATPVGFPYRHSTSPKRFTIIHTQITFYNADGSVRESDSGYCMGRMDRHDDYVLDYLPRLHLTQKSFRSSHGTRSFLSCAYNHWLPSANPNLPFQTSLILSNKTNTYSRNVTRFAFELIGPDNMELSISPLIGSTLKSLSFVHTPPLVQYWGSRQTYYMNLIYGVDKSPIQFYLDIEKNANDGKRSFNIEVVSHFTHHKEYDTQEFKKIVGDFPDWFHVSSSTSAHDRWTY